VYRTNAAANISSLSVCYLSSCVLPSIRRHTRAKRYWSSDLCSSDLASALVSSYLAFPSLPRPKARRSISVALSLGSPPAAVSSRSEERRVGIESITCGNSYHLWPDDFVQLSDGGTSVVEHAS